MTASKYEAEVLHNEKITNDICRLTLHAPPIAESANGGQFVMVKAGRDNESPLLRRPFSIHQASENGQIQILFKVVGKGTHFLSTRKIGESLNLVGPLGNGFRLTAGTINSENICLVGGGMGAAPLYFLAKQIIIRKVDFRDVQVLLGGATASEIEVLQKDFDSLGVSVSVATDDGSSGHHGLATELIKSNLDHSENWQVYSCGPHPMMKAIAGYCAKMNWTCQVSLETLMACGVSACLGCAIRSSGGGDKNSNKPYLHVCKEGPVFNAGAVAWE